MDDGSQQQGDTGCWIGIRLTAMGITKLTSCHEYYVGRLQMTEQNKAIVKVWQMHRYSVGAHSDVEGYGGRDRQKDLVLKLTAVR
jgi:hypothetical protein